MSDDGDLRINLDVTRGEALEIRVDGVPIRAHPGESIAAALFAAGLRCTHRSTQLGEARGFFCGMGVCWECAVVIDGTRTERACMEPVRAGLRVGTLPPADERPHSDTHPHPGARAPTDDDP